VEKYGTARHATDGSTTWRMRFACQATHTQNTQCQKNVMIIAFPRQQYIRKRAANYIKCTLPVLTEQPSCIGHQLDAM